MGKKQTITEQVVEIRYKPHAQIVDKRGEVAAKLSIDPFDIWNISNNNITFSSSKNKNVEAFFSYKNIGILSRSQNDLNNFNETASNFFKSSWPYIPSNELMRIGIRSKYLFPVDDFKETFDNYKKEFLALSDEKIKLLGGELVDFGFPLNFVDGDKYFNIITGPMEKKQFEQFINLDGLDCGFDNAIFLDVDYFGDEFSPHIKLKDVTNIIDNGLEKATAILSNISEWVTKQR